MKQFNPRGWGATGHESAEQRQKYFASLFFNGLDRGQNLGIAEHPHQKNHKCLRTHGCLVGKPFQPQRFVPALAVALAMLPLVALLRVISTERRER